MGTFELTNNTQFRKLNSKSLRELKELLNDYKLSYRNKLKLDERLQFGVEIEFDGFPMEMVNSFLYIVSPEWKVVPERSLAEGGEVVSPILHNNENSWEYLNEVCSFLSIAGAKDDELTGAHVHAGADMLGYNTRAWKNLGKLIMAYENIIFRFSSGDYLISRESVLKYAKPMAIQFKEIYDLYKDKCDNTYDLSYYLTCERHKSVNFAKMFKNMNVDNSFKQDSTIEFRCPNGSLNPIIWQNNVNMFVKLLYYAKSPYFNRDLILKRMNINSFIYDLDNSYILNVYNDVFIDQALEFCDLIFNNNLDKINFLRQYFKELKVSNNSRAFAKARKFTK